MLSQRECDTKYYSSHSGYFGHVWGGSFCGICWLNTFENSNLFRSPFNLQIHEITIQSNTFLLFIVVTGYRMEKKLLRVFSRMTQLLTVILNSFMFTSFCVCRAALFFNDILGINIFPCIQDKSMVTLLTFHKVFFKYRPFVGSCIIFECYYCVGV